MIFKLENISLEFADKKIFDKIEFVFNSGDKIGIVGDNGCGKTSFLNIILNKVNFSGKITFENKNFGYLSQDDTLKLLTEKKAELEVELQKAENIVNTEIYEKLLTEYESIVSSNGASKEEELVERFEFNKETYLREISENLSGGETTKLKLIKLFANSSYDYLLLDEPSNHLDENSRAILIEELGKYSSYIIVSHDIELLNAAVNKILEIRNGEIKLYHGNYDYYLDEKEKELDEILKTRTENSKEIAKIKENIVSIKAWSSRQLKSKTKHLKMHQVLRDLGTGKGSADSGIHTTKKIIGKMYTKMDSIEMPEIAEEDEIKINYLDFQKPNTESIILENLKYSKENFTLDINKFELKSDEKIALIGKNGSGKTTLLKIITGEIKVDSGTIKIGNKVKLGYLSQKNENLNLENNLFDEISKINQIMDESEIRKYLGKFLFKKNDVFKKIKDLSGGEKIRASILKLILTGCNVLLLDEPTNHLDIKSKNILASALKDYPGSIIVVSHDEYFLEKFITRTVIMENGKIM